MKPTLLTAEHLALAARAREDFKKMEPGAPFDVTARAFAGKRGEHVDASQELLAMGVASVAAGMSQGFPIGGSNSRTAA